MRKIDVIIKDLFLMIFALSFITDASAAGSLCIYSKHQAQGSQALYRASDVAKNDILEILEALDMSEKLPVYVGPVGNAAAVTEQGGARYILYNEQFLMSLYNINGWAPVSVLAHEVGHHVGNMQNTNDSHTRELNADEISGCALAHMGASLADAKVAMTQGLPSSGSSSHPATNQRLQYIEKGWNTCKTL